MPLEIAPHAKDRDSQRQELEQITHVHDFFAVEVLNVLNRPLLGRLIKANRFCFSVEFLVALRFWDACPSVKKIVKENSFRDGIQHS